VLGVAPRGSMWSPGPAFYMDKLVVGPGARDALHPDLLDARVAVVLDAVAEAGAVARRAADGESLAMGELWEVVEETHAVLERHISFECNEVLPRLEPLEHLGPDRMERVRARHERMRGHMRMLQPGRPPADVAEALLAIDAEGTLPAGGWEQLKAADAIIFGAPTYMGSVSWQFKKFADASSRPWYAQEWKDKVAAGFTNSAGMNGDKLNTLFTLFTLAMQHSMVWVSQGLMPSNSLGAKRDDINYLVSYSGAVAASPSDGGTSDMAAGDLATARLFGQRVAEVTRRLKRA
jgi:hypothetical protein